MEEIYNLDVLRISNDPTSFCRYSKRLNKELECIINAEKYDSNIFTIRPSNTKLSQWRGLVYGPPDTPYENKSFIIEITLDEDKYPFRSPIIKFLTPIYHYNVNVDGNVSIDILKDWRPMTTIRDLMLEIYKMLQLSDIKDHMDNNQKDIYVERAKEISGRFGIPNK